MKLKYLYSISFLFLQFFSTAQNTTLLKYKGDWSYVQPPTFLIQSITIKEIRILNELGINWSFDLLLLNPETGDYMENSTPYLCTKDSTVVPKWEHYLLKDSVKTDTIFDYSRGDERFVNPELIVKDSVFKRKVKVYKNTILPDSITNLSVDVFTFISSCMEEEAKIEIVFYSEKKGILFIYTPSQLQVGELIKQ